MNMGRLASYPSKDLGKLFLALIVAAGGSFFALLIDLTWGAILGGVIMVALAIGAWRARGGIDAIAMLILATTGVALIAYGIVH